MKHVDAKNPDPKIQKVNELIKDMKIAMLTTIDPDGALRSRPMASQKMDFDGDLWFFTSKASGKIHSIMNDQDVNLAYASASDNRYVSISGRAELIEDQSKKEELWGPLYQAWFEKGLEDPDLVLLKVHVESIEYWDSPSSGVVHLMGLTKQAEQHEKLSLRH